MKQGRVRETLWPSNVQLRQDNTGRREADVNEGREAYLYRARSGACEELRAARSLNTVQQPKPPWAATGTRIPAGWTGLARTRTFGAALPGHGAFTLRTHRHVSLGPGPPIKASLQK